MVENETNSTCFGCSPDQRVFVCGRLLRATALIGDALGHSWVGLLLLRAMDPRLQTPVPLAYAYKMMMFFVPASGGKNAIVIGEYMLCAVSSI